jgi:hypothetical protein
MIERAYHRHFFDLSPRRHAQVRAALGRSAGPRAPLGDEAWDRPIGSVGDGSFQQRRDNAQPRSSRGPGRGPRSPSTPRRRLWRMRCAIGTVSSRTPRASSTIRGLVQPDSVSRSPAPDPPRRARANALTVAAPYAALHPPLSEICPPCPCPTPTNQCDDRITPTIRWSGRRNLLRSPSCHGACGMITPHSPRASTRSAGALHHVAVKPSYD